MKKHTLFLIASILVLSSFSSFQDPGIADPANYLDDIKVELNKEWPQNNTLNLVFHGHSVPAGYYKHPW